MNGFQDKKKTSLAAGFPPMKGIQFLRSLSLAFISLRASKTVL